MKLWDLYGNLIANFISAGTLIKRTAMDSLSIIPSYSKIMTKKAETHVWIITEIPVHFNSNPLIMIRRAMQERFPEVHTMVDMHGFKEIVDVNSKIFRRRLAYSVGLYEDYKEAFESLSTADRALGKVFRSGSRSLNINKETLEKHKDTSDSYLYVQREKKDGAGFFTVNMFVRAQSKDPTELNRYGKELMDLVRGEDITIFPVHGDIKNYLTNFGPATYPQGDLRKFPRMLMSDENISMVLPTRTRGLFGEGKGVLFGLDIQSSLPAFVNLFSSSAAQVFLVTAVSGYGKTSLMNTITIGLRADNRHVSVIDMKGDEWEKIFPYLDNYVKIDMDALTWVNTLRLDKLDLNTETGIEAFILAVNSTVSVFKTAISITDKEGSEYDVNDFLEKAVKKVYNTLKGFKPHDTKTFHLTKKLKYSDVIDALYGISKGNFNDKQKETLDLILQRSREEFSEENMPLDKEITLSNILDTGYVVYAFNRAKGAGVSNKDSMRVRMCSFLNKSKHYHRRLRGEHTIEIYEEVQIADSVGSGSELTQLIKEDVTIGRSDNVSVFLVTNAMSTLNRKDMQSVKSNITGLLVGKISEDDIDILSTINGGKEIIRNVRKISGHTSSKYSHCFALRVDNGRMSDHTIIKSIIPDDIEKAIRQRDQD